MSVVGASPQPFVLDRPNRFETIGVTFRPGGAVALLGVSADELDGAAMSRIAAAPERCSIADVSASVGVSRRRLEETFRVAVGLTPKRFQRLWRFRRALERIDHHQDQGWAAFALERGYYDQAHFSNEFRHHTGLAPEGYLAARTPALNHVRIDTAT